jgi:hypothetical protein
MKRNLLALLVMAGGLSTAMFGQQYPNGRNVNAQYDNDRWDDDDYDQGVYAPTPPPMPRSAYRRPPMPGAGFFWVDGYWNFRGGRYNWVAGYWMRPPHVGGAWVRPRYSGGRFYRGFWSGGRQAFNRGPDRNNDRSQRGIQTQPYRAPAPNRSGFQAGDRDHRGRP